MATGTKSMTLQEVAASLGVHYMTVYRYVRQGRLPATRQGAKWQVRPADVKALRGYADGGERRGAARTVADIEGLERRMLAGDSAGAWWLVESHLNGGSDPSDVLTDLVVPALRSIGEQWAEGSVSIADEHRATAVAQQVVGRLGLQFGRRGTDRGTVALAAPPGDLHVLPVAIVADLLRWRGFNVLELGGNTPAEVVGDAVVREERLLAVGIVATIGGLDAEVASSARSVRAARPDLPIFLGGASIQSEAQARRLGGDSWTGPGPGAAVETVERLAKSREGRTRCRVA